MGICFKIYNQIERCTYSARSKIDSFSLRSWVARGFLYTILLLNLSLLFYFTPWPLSLSTPLQVPYLFALLFYIFCFFALFPLFYFQTLFNIPCFLSVDTYPVFQFPLKLFLQSFVPFMPPAPFPLFFEYATSNQFVFLFFMPLTLFYFHFFPILSNIVLSSPFMIRIAFRSRHTHLYKFSTHIHTYKIIFFVKT
ncbi:uncharacterized protein EAF02_010065 [Botrytis sinoallii]|uniref:uncharacterized protein n=1 Tax=Botrytis sinoallii TaxID=1463999 RepID=UPI0019005B90|nr:uncharacterized protein EAF02_010065 [Botrytis sinoallii]KAF7865642.1 hypothetical protein EAF02_010065 [Botrytis sinoallii]